MQLILVSGLSGSGKSIALNVLEDSSYFCIDNLPLPLLTETARYLLGSGVTQAAISIDARSNSDLNQLPQIIATLRQEGLDVRILFLEAKTETLVKRFSETRRRHPLSDPEHTLTECIEHEQEQLEAVSDLGHRMDTSEISPNTLRAWIKDFIELDRSRLTLLFQSFGFKHGIPLDADYVFDVRCLPNPHYDPALRPLTGMDPEVCAFLQKDPMVQKMLEDISRFVADWLPCFIRDNRNYLTIALGCTGGQHRSVFFAETLAPQFSREYQVLIRHRELS
ncbi:MAG: RNase adapter RapZ [Nitrosomonadales bacterium]|nr:MAG: RNase adapter RapZ [Nitrosomonadales bacterium]